MTPDKSAIVEKLIQQNGFFQKRLAVMLTLLALPNGAQLMFGIFLIFLPPFTCRLPPGVLLVDRSATAAQQQNVSTLMFADNSTVEATVGECSITLLDGELKKFFFCVQPRPFVCKISLLVFAFSI